MPTAALGVMAYGPPKTVAVAAEPALFKVTLLTVSEFNNPVTVNPVPAKVYV